ncbi:hypothetical protein [Vibrio parahaemolyticus]|nr:hypothetical protein [Vibrio parahaemolyticus]EGQ8195737.1 hypothetical protein [Vibrio parahaemolyticus]EKB1992546.1 hypothetical protein [Vibrio parahaemolyticus]EME0136032.1 hypothetical protein [Vibrio parahaemolyticus]MCQ9044359.1 hypothetical protein [Vibrio parahaemolyticus]MCX8769075.1 hypothetical protein [Vibrio parahaemolyticus]
MYDIKKLAKKEAELKASFHDYFVDFFGSFDYTDISTKKVRVVDVDSHEDVTKLIYGTGLYVIFTDYQSDKNPCSLSVDGLKAIYRGHGTRVKKRVESHLFNSTYNKNKERTNYTVCMKLNGQNGIDIDEEPFRNYRWKVITHSMSGSSKTMREQAEQGFDSVYSRPLGSNA